MPFKYSQNSIILGSPAATHLVIGADLPPLLVAAGFKAAFIWYWQGNTNGYYYEGIRPGALPADSVLERGLVQPILGVDTKFEISEVTLFASTYPNTTFPTGSTINNDGKQFTRAYPTGNFFSMQLRRDVAATIASGAKIPWTVKDYDYANLISSTKLFVGESGWWKVSGTVRHQAIASGTALSTQVFKNGGAAIAGASNTMSANSSGSAGNGIPIGPILVSMVAGDYLEINVGNNLATAVNCNDSSVLFERVVQP